MLIVVREEFGPTNPDNMTRLFIVVLGNYLSSSKQYIVSCPAWFNWNKDSLPIDIVVSMT